MTPATKSAHGTPALVTAIALFKLVKGALLLVVGVALLRLVHQDLHDVVAHWVEQFRLDPDNRLIHGLLERCAGVRPRTLQAASVGTLIYSALYLAEGIGLLGDRLWAEWLTVITTAGFLPLEVYEIIRRLTSMRIILLVLNVLVLGYLIRRLVLRHREARATRRGLSG